MCNDETKEGREESVCVRRRNLLVERYFVGGKWRTGLVGDCIGFCSREVLRYLTLQVLLLLLDNQELLS